MLYLVLFEEVVEAAHPDVANHDVGGLEDGADCAGVVHREDDGLGAEGVGFAAVVVVEAVGLVVVPKGDVEVIEGVDAHKGDCFYAIPGSMGKS